MSKKLLGSVLVVLAVFVTTTVWTSPAYAAVEHYYQGNLRNPGYGVKANIGTPTGNPYNPVGSLVFNFVSNYYEPAPNIVYWVQCGWCDGDGAAVMDGWTISTYPRSYREANAPVIYDFDLYSAQGYGTVRTYECVYTTNGQWKTLIQSVPRGEYCLLCTKTLVEALSELIADQGQMPPPNEDWASFRGVQYKGEYSYIDFWQSNFFPPLIDGGAIWFDTDDYSPHQYDTHTN